MCNLWPKNPSGAKVNEFPSSKVNCLDIKILTWRHVSIHHVTLYKIIVLQKRALRLITGSPFCRNWIYLIKVVNIHKNQLLQFMFKFKNMILPKFCFNFCTLSDDGKYNTRCHSYFKPRAFCTSIYQRSIGVASLCMWDSLPSDFKDINYLKGILLCISIFLYLHFVSGAHYQWAAIIATLVGLNSVVTAVTESHSSRHGRHGESLL